MTALHPEGVVDGMVLAAMVLDDRTGGALAGASPTLAARVAARLEALAALTREARHREVRTLVERLTSLRGDEALPARAAAILAGDAPPEARRRWLAHAPPVRRGFEVTRSLKTNLRRLAAPEGPDSADEDRAAADELDTLPPARATGLRRLAEELDVDPRRALGALLLGARGQRGGDARSRRLRAIGAELALVWALEDASAGGTQCLE